MIMFFYIHNGDRRHEHYRVQPLIRERVKKEVKD